MSRKKFRIELVGGETEHITYFGRRLRRPTVLIRVGRWSMSKKAFLLGALLSSFQVLDGLLTYIGLKMFGISMEGNTFLRTLIHAYGSAPVLFFAKTMAICFVLLLTYYAHRRRWVRPILGFMIVVYLGLAVLPWTYIISKANAQNANQPLTTIDQNSVENRK